MRRLFISNMVSKILTHKYRAAALATAMLVLGSLVAPITTNHTLAAGVVTDGEFCNTDYEGVNHQQQLIVPGDFSTSKAAICLKHLGDSQETANGFTVTSYQKLVPGGGVVAYPNIAAGYEWGRHARRSFIPVQEKNDGNPSSSVNVTVPKTDHGYNVAYDAWFNKEYVSDWKKLGQNDGAEVMVWLRGAITFASPVGSYTIDGHKWLLYHWVTGHNGKTWNLDIFIAQPNVNSFDGNLNPFFNVAMSRGYLDQNWWLTGIDFGFELASPTGQATGLTVNNYSLNGISTQLYQSATVTQSYTATRSFTVTRGGYSKTATATVTKSASATAGASGSSASDAMATASTQATREALAAAKTAAIIAADAQAKSMAIIQLNQMLAPVVPNVVGLNLSLASAKLNQYGYRHHWNRPLPGWTMVVVSQNPAAGSHLPQGSYDILTTIPEKKVPNVIGKRLGYAAHTLVAAGFRYRGPKPVRGKVIYITGEAPRAGLQPRGKYITLTGVAR